MYTPEAVGPGSRNYCVFSTGSQNNTSPGKYKCIIRLLCTAGTSGVVVGDGGGGFWVLWVVFVCVVGGGGGGGGG